MPGRVSQLNSLPYLPYYALSFSWWAQHNFMISLAHVPEKANSRADALSHNQLSRFFSISPQADAHPTQPLPGGLLRPQALTFSPCYRRQLPHPQPKPTGQATGITCPSAADSVS